MRFALLGNHPDGLEFTNALLATGRHELVCYSATSIPADCLSRWGTGVQRVHDLEEVLADPAVELVVVASSLANRPAHLRRALQSERDVVCVHPADQTPDIAYEAVMIQQDTRCLLLPLLPEVLHPAIQRLREFIDQTSGETLLGSFRLLDVEHWSTEEVLLNTEMPEQKLAVPGWDVLRVLGGEIAEVVAVAPGEALEGGVPILMAGRFEQQGLFQLTLLPGQPESRWCLKAIGSRGQAEVLFPLGTPGPAFLSWQDEEGALREEYWDAWNSWGAMVEVLERAWSAKARTPRATPATSVSWQDAIRSLELDDAARRSVQKRRSSLLEYPEATEEVGFKGTMTLVGCALVWGIILLAILSRWVPQLGWAVIPVLGVFLLLQLLRWLIPGRDDQAPDQPGRPPDAHPLTQDQRSSQTKESSS